MVRVGLMTFHRAINFGAVLQTYALQDTINQHGGECKVIDYRSSFIENYYRPFYIHRSGIVSMLKQSVKALIKYRSRKIKKVKVEHFVYEYLNLSEVTDTNMKKLNTEFDIFITGSDQVFNTDITKKDADRYFLSFAEKPRYSYAASFGKNFVAEKDQAWISSELGKYRSVSVREESGIEIVKTLIDKEPIVALDPTLLKDANEWRSIEKQPNKAGKPYILVYNMLSSKLLYDTALKLSDSKGMRVIFVNNKSDSLRRQYNSFNYCDSLSPEEFLWLVDNAQYVLCSSFHGTVFSILFHKQFVSVLPEDEPKNTRITSLLDMLGLSNRFFIDTFDPDKIDNEIDWESVDCRLKKQKAASINYIDAVIEGRI